MSSCIVGNESDLVSVLLGVRNCVLTGDIITSSSASLRSPHSSLSLSLRNHYQFRYSYRPSSTGATQNYGSEPRSALRLELLPSWRRELSKYSGSSCPYKLSHDPVSPIKHQTYSGGRCRLFQEAHVHRDGFSTLASLHSL